MIVDTLCTICAETSLNYGGVVNTFVFPLATISHFIGSTLGNVVCTLMLREIESANMPLNDKNMALVTGQVQLNKVKKGL